MDNKLSLKNIPTGRFNSPPVEFSPPNGRTEIPVEEEKTPTARGNGKRWLKRALVGTVLVLIVGGLVKFSKDWWTVGRFVESTDDAYVGGDVTVIAPKVSGFVAEVAVRDNQAVRAGDLLVKLDTRDWQAALSKADASVAAQQATLTNLDSVRKLQEAIIAQARAEIAATDAEVNRTRDDEARYRMLLAAGAESTQGFQKAEALFKQAAAAGDKAHATLTAAKRQLEVIETQKLRAQAALEEALAGRELARLNLSYTELRAPIDGVVGNRSAQIGAYATTGSQLVSVVPAHGLWIDANFKETQIAHMRPGSPATVEIDSIPGKVLHGHVVSIAPATGAQFSILPPENATGNFTRIVQRLAVRIALADESLTAGQLRPGLSVIAKVDTREAKGSL